MEALNTAWQAASQDIYNAQQAEGAAGGDAGGEAGQPQEEAAQDTSKKGNDDEVTDVDFEEVK
jgi:molecular chaperone DnaK